MALTSDDFKFPSIETLGLADWIWDDEIGMHLPCCSQTSGRWHCLNGPLNHNEIITGDCGGEHLPKNMAMSAERGLEIIIQAYNHINDFGTDSQSRIYWGPGTALFDALEKVIKAT